MYHLEKMPVAVLLAAAGFVASTGAEAQVTLFQHCNYGGTYISLGEGEYDLRDLTAGGALNDDLSAISVAPGFTATIYEHAAFGGRALRITGNDECLVDDGFNDIISSIRVTRGQ